MRFSAFGGRAGIYARVTAHRLKGALALKPAKLAAFFWPTAQAVGIKKKRVQGPPGTGCFFGLRANGQVLMAGLRC